MRNYPSLIIRSPCAHHGHIAIGRGDGPPTSRKDVVVRGDIATARRGETAAVGGAAAPVGRAAGRGAADVGGNVGGNARGPAAAVGGPAGSWGTTGALVVLLHAGDLHVDGRVAVAWARVFVELEPQREADLVNLRVVVRAGVVVHLRWLSRNHCAGVVALFDDILECLPDHDAMVGVTVEDAVRLPFPDGTFDFAPRAATFGALAAAASARYERLGGITRDASERSSLDGNGHGFLVADHRGNVRFAKDVSDAVEDEPGKAAVLRPRRNDPCKRRA